MTELAVELTNRCHLSCLHCLPDSGPPRPSEIAAEVLAAASPYLTQCGIDSIQLTGGEPLLDPNLVDLVETLTNDGICVRIVSSGTVGHGSNKLRSLVGMGATFSVSVEGFTAEKNDYIRGPGTFAKALAFMDHLSCMETDFDVLLTATSLNVDHVPAAESFREQVHARRVIITQASRQGRALLNEQLLFDSTDADLASELVSAFPSQQADAYDDNCWVSESSTFLSAEGLVFQCSEPYQRGARPMGEVSDGDELVKLLACRTWPSLEHLKCCFAVRVSDQIVLITNSDRECVGVQRADIESPVEISL